MSSLQKSWPIICLLILMLAGCSKHTTSVFDATRTIISGGLSRTYIVHLPPAYQNQGAQSFPVVLAFHGGGGKADGMDKLTHMNATADQDDFIVVYPNGYKNSWADGRGVTNAEKDNVDDVQYTSDLITDLAAHYRIDPKRIYATGISNGGFFSERLACDLSSTIAAIASVAATFSVNLAGRCAPTRPVPFLLIQGTADPLVPFEGGTVALERGEVLSAKGAVADWVAIDGCTSPSIDGNDPDVADDDTTISHQFYTNCSGGTKVSFYAIHNGGHTWPGGYQYLPEVAIGKTSRDMDASEVIWQFFSDNSLP